MRYSVFIITIFLLMGCNLGNDNQSPVQQTPTQPVSESDEPITYWQMLPINEVVPTEDDVMLFDQLILRRIEDDTPRTDSNIINLERAIQGVIDTATVWNADSVSIESLMIEDGLATIRLNGTISAVGGAILSAVPTQFYLTVFENPTIDSVLITLDGENIANLGISHDSQFQENDVVFTRAMLETQLSK